MKIDNLGKYYDLIYSDMNRKSEMYQIPIPDDKHFVKGDIVDYDTKDRYNCRFQGRGKILSCSFDVSAPNCHIVDIDSGIEHHMFRLEYLELVTDKNDILSEKE